MKRCFDAVFAALALVLLALPMLIIALGVWVGMGWPIFFTQRRPGRDGVSFQIVKFRTMRDAFDDRGLPLPDDDRLTPLGRVLRATSLDELPELWNVLRGDMSLVGPRPLLMQYLPLYTPRQMRRHEMRPGLTGWAQIHGRNRISWEEKFELDVWYVDHCSLWLDLKILAATVIKVLKLENISPEGSVSPPPFEGTPPQQEGTWSALAPPPCGGNSLAAGQG